WGTDGKIAFNPSPDGPIGIVPASGGTPTMLETGPASDPDYLPDEGIVLAVVENQGKSFDEADIIAFDLKTKQKKVVVRGTAPRYVRSAGRLLFARAAKLWSIAFDPKSMTVSGEPRVIVEPI